ncbi:MAG: twin-arginine translocase TatA/TatE family subunit [Solirubrobacterales bacterium]|nr:twin-arginine translocase TatA/TatE family subunit [Solirubrobacterales bacterium]
MSTPGATELLVVLVIVLLILGPKRLPSLGRQLGGGFREFRRSIRGSDETSGDRDATTPDSRSALTSSMPGETVDGEVVPERRPS